MARFKECANPSQPLVSLVPLADNRFSSTIPTQLFQLTLLKVIELDDNFLTGTIPEGIAQLTALTRLELGTFRKLVFVTFFSRRRISRFVSFQYTTDTNRLTGTVPPLPSILKDFKCQLEENNFSNVDNGVAINCDT